MLKSGEKKKGKEKRRGSGVLPGDDQIALLWGCSCPLRLWHTQTPSFSVAPCQNLYSVLGITSPSSLLGDA